MIINKIENVDYEDISKQIAVKILSNDKNFYAIWIEKSCIVMELNYSKKDNKIKLLEGKLGLKIQNSNLTLEDKVLRCAEALQHVLWDYIHKPEEIEQKFTKSNRLK